MTGSLLVSPSFRLANTSAAFTALNPPGKYAIAAASTVSPSGAGAGKEPSNCAGIGADLVVAALVGLEGVGDLLVGAPGRHGVEQVVGIVAHHLQGRGGLAGGLTGVAVQDDLLVLGQLGQAVGREELLARDVDGARDVTVGVILGGADVNHERVVAGVAIVQVGVEVGGLDVLGAAAEVLLSRSLDRVAVLGQRSRRDDAEQHDDQQRE